MQIEHEDAREIKEAIYLLVLIEVTIVSVILLATCSRFYTDGTGKAVHL